MVYSSRTFEQCHRFAIWYVGSPTYCCNEEIVFVRNKNSEHITITYRNNGRLDKESFIATLKEAPWDCAFVFENINVVVDAWYKLFNSVLDEYLPQIQKRVKREVQPKWFSNEISQEIKKRDMLLKSPGKAKPSRTGVNSNGLKTRSPN